MIIFQRVFKLWSGHEIASDHQGEITQKVQKEELPFLYATHRLDQFYITVKYHDYISKGIQVIERTRICMKKHQRGDNWKSVKGKSPIFVRNTSSWPVLHNCEVSSTYSKRFSNHRADTKMFTDGRMDRQTDGRTDGRTNTRLIAISPEPFGRGIKWATWFENILGRTLY